MKMCPFKTTAVQAEFARLKAIPKQGGVSITRIGAMREAREVFGQCDEEECAMWGYYHTGNRCGLINYGFDPRTPRETKLSSEEAAK